MDTNQNLYEQFEDTGEQEEEIDIDHLDSKTKIVIEDIIHPHLEQRRWFILIAFGTLTFTNASSFVTFSPILSLAQEYYGKSQDEILWFSNVFYISFIFGCLPTIFMYDWRFDACMYASAFFNALGGMMRYVSKDNYTWALVSTILITIAQLWILAAPAIISERWFGAHERILSLSIAFFSNVLGLSYGYLSGAYIVEKAPDIEKYLLINGIAMSVPLVLILIFVRNSPKVKPNFTAESGAKLNMIESLKTCYLNWKNLLAISSLSLFLGVSWTFEAVLDEIFDFTKLETGYLGLSMNVAGTIGGLISSIFLEKQLAKNVTPQYDIIIRIFATISYVLVIILTIVQWLDSDIQIGFVFVITSLIGMGFNAFVPIAGSSMLESVYPVSEIVGYTIFNQAANFFGLIGNFVAGVGLWLICVLMTPLFIYLMFFYKTSLHRLKKEDKIRKVSIKKSILQCRKDTNS